MPSLPAPTATTRPGRGAGFESRIRKKPSMSTDFAEKEREFLASLKEDTGRDLAEWMTAISGQGITGKNDIIDWLRQQGFMFWKASWLERIHHNAGNPIYAGDPTTPPATAANISSQAPVAAIEVAEASQFADPEPMPAKSCVETPRVPATGPDPTALDDLIAKAKALRPLAQLLLREIAKAVPDAGFTPKAAHVSISSGGEFAVLAIGPRELRLGLALGNEPFGGGLTVARFSNPLTRISSGITHMLVLTDARQVNARLLANIQLAAAKGR